MAWFRRSECARLGHWWDTPVQYEFSEYFGAIVCGEQKSHIVTVETRNCRRCPATDSIHVGEPVYNGWS